MTQEPITREHAGVPTRAHHALHRYLMRLMRCEERPQSTALNFAAFGSEWDWRSGWSRKWDRSHCFGPPLRSQCARVLRRVSDPTGGPHCWPSVTLFPTKKYSHGSKGVSQLRADVGCSRSAQPHCCIATSHRIACCRGVAALDGRADETRFSRQCHGR